MIVSEFSGFTLFVASLWVTKECSVMKRKWTTLGLGEDVILYKSALINFKKQLV